MSQIKKLKFSGKKVSVDDKQSLDMSNAVFADPNGGLTKLDGGAVDLGLNNMATKSELRDIESKLLDYLNNGTNELDNPRFQINNRKDIENGFITDRWQTYSNKTFDNKKTVHTDTVEFESQTYVFKENLEGKSELCIMDDSRLRVMDSVQLSVGANPTFIKSENKLYVVAGNSATNTMELYLVNNGKLELKNSVAMYSRFINPFTFKGITYFFVGGINNTMETHLMKVSNDSFSSVKSFGLGVTRSVCKGIQVDNDAIITLTGYQTTNGFGDVKVEFIKMENETTFTAESNFLLPRVDYENLSMLVDTDNKLWVAVSSMKTSDSDNESGKTHLYARENNAMVAKQVLDTNWVRNVQLISHGSALYLTVVHADNGTDTKGNKIELYKMDNDTFTSLNSLPLDNVDKNLTFELVDGMVSIFVSGNEALMFRMENENLVKVQSLIDTKTNTILVLDNKYVYPFLDSVERDSAILEYDTTIDLFKAIQGNEKPDLNRKEIFNNDTVKHSTSFTYNDETYFIGCNETKMELHKVNYNGDITKVTEITDTLGSIINTIEFEGDVYAFTSDRTSKVMIFKIASNTITKVKEIAFVNPNVITPFIKEGNINILVGNDALPSVNKWYKLTKDNDTFNETELQSINSDAKVFELSVTEYKGDWYLTVPGYRKDDTHANTVKVYKLVSNSFTEVQSISGFNSSNALLEVVEDRLFMFRIMSSDKDTNNSIEIFEFKDSQFELIDNEKGGRLSYRGNVCRHDGNLYLGLGVYNELDINVSVYHVESYIYKFNVDAIGNSDKDTLEVVTGVYTENCLYMEPISYNGKLGYMANNMSDTKKYIEIDLLPTQDIGHFTDTTLNINASDNAYVSDMVEYSDALYLALVTINATNLTNLKPIRIYKIYPNGKIQLITEIMKTNPQQVSLEVFRNKLYLLAPMYNIADKAAGDAITTNIMVIENDKVVDQFSIPEGYRYAHMAKLKYHPVSDKLYCIYGERRTPGKLNLFEIDKEHNFTKIEEVSYTDGYSAELFVDGEFLYIGYTAHSSSVRECHIKMLNVKTKVLTTMYTGSFLYGRGITFAKYKGEVYFALYTSQHTHGTYCFKIPKDNVIYGGSNTTKYVNVYKQSSTAFMEAHLIVLNDMLYLIGAIYNSSNNGIGEIIHIDLTSSEKFISLGFINNYNSTRSTCYKDSKGNIYYGCNIESNKKYHLSKINLNGMRIDGNRVHHIDSYEYKGLTYLIVTYDSNTNYQHLFVYKDGKFKKILTNTKSKKMSKILEFNNTLFYIDATYQVSGNYNQSLYLKPINEDDTIGSAPVGVSIIGLQGLDTLVIGDKLYIATANYWNGSTRKVNSEVWEIDKNYNSKKIMSIPTKGGFGVSLATLNGYLYLAMSEHYDDNTYPLDSGVYKINLSDNTYNKIYTSPSKGSMNNVMFNVNGNLHAMFGVYNTDNEDLTLELVKIKPDDTHEVLYTRTDRRLNIVRHVNYKGIDFIIICRRKHNNKSGNELHSLLLGFKDDKVIYEKWIANRDESLDCYSPHFMEKDNKLFLFMPVTSTAITNRHEMPYEISVDLVNNKSVISIDNDSNSNTTKGITLTNPKITKQKAAIKQVFNWNPTDDQLTVRLDIAKVNKATTINVVLNTPTKRLENVISASTSGIYDTTFNIKNIDNEDDVASITVFISGNETEVTIQEVIANFGDTIKDQINKDIILEGLVCDKYYRTSYDVGQKPGELNSPNPELVLANNPNLLILDLGTELDRLPVYDVYNPITGKQNSVRNHTTNSDINVTVNYELSTDKSLVLNLNTAVQTGDLIKLHYIANAELLEE